MVYQVEPEEDEATLRNPSVSQYFVSVAKPNQVNTFFLVL
jgi:hypothetical protein